MTFLELDNVAAKTNEPLPPGAYTAKIVEAEAKKTKAGGQMLKVKLKVDSGDHKGRVVYHTFNTINSSAQAQEIGRGELKGMMKCAGMDDSKLESVADLKGKVVDVHTGLEKNNGTLYAKVKYFDYPSAQEKAEEEIPF